MEIFLDERGFLVSGTKSLAQRFGLLLPDERIGLRFVAHDFSGSKALFFLVLEGISPDKAPQLVNAVRSNPIYVNLKGILQPLYVLTSLTNGEFYLDRCVTSGELAQWFYQQEPALQNNLGTGKKTNRPESQRKSDFFRAFTGRYLSRYCTSNDIDALRLAESRFHYPLILELKKPKEAMDTWEPYIDDCPNYMYLKALSQKRDFEFRVIAYSPHSSEKVKLLLNVECDKPNRKAAHIRYEWALVSPHEALQSVARSVKPGTSVRRRQF